MTRPDPATSGLALALVVWIGAAGTAAAQPAPPDHDHAQPPASANAQEPAGAGEYPSLHISGFADVNFTAQDKTEGVRGFSLGQFVLHMASALSPRVNFFGELSFSPRSDAGTGMPAATGYNAEVERAIIRFDQS